MRILQVIPYFSLRRGGDVNVCFNVSKELSGRGHEVVIATTDFEFEKDLAASLPNVLVIPFKCIANIGLMLISPSMKKWTAKNVAKFDVVHLHDLRSYQNNIIHSCATKEGIPYVLQPHGSTPRVISKKRLKWLYDVIYGRKIMRDAKGIIAVSEYEAKHDERMGVPKERIFVVYNGMDVDSYESLPKYGSFRRKLGVDGRMILYLGRIHKSKGLDFAIRAFSRMLVGSDNDISFVVAGSDDGYRARLEKLVEMLGLTDKVLFTGFVDEEDKMSAYVDADLFIHTVRYMGGVGIAPLEAILCNTPVIVTEQCGEVIKRICPDFLVEYGDTSSLARKMRHVLDNLEQSRQSVEMVKEYILENLTWDRACDDIETIYERCVRRGGS